MSAHRLATCVAGAATMIVTLALPAGVGGVMAADAQAVCAAPTLVHPRLASCPPPVAASDRTASSPRIALHDGTLLIRADRGDNTVTVRQDARGMLQVFMGRRAVRVAAIPARDLRIVRLVASPGRDTISLRGIVGAHPLTIFADDRIELADALSAPSLRVRARDVSITGTITSARIHITGTRTIEVAKAARIRSRRGGDGGDVVLASRVVSHLGTLDASGRRGGTIRLRARLMIHAGRLSAAGTNVGGTIDILARRSYQATLGATSDTGGARAGLTRIRGGAIFTSGTHRSDGEGGRLVLLGRTLTTRSALLTADAPHRAGRIDIGSLAATRTADLDARTRVSASAPNGRGGLIELGARTTIATAADLDVAGRRGRLIIDPKNVTVSADAAFPSIELVDPTPGAGNLFGGIVPLSTGRVAVSDSRDDAAASNAGAVYLFDGLTGALLATLTGSTANDSVGRVNALKNGNYLVHSPAWNNGGTADVGAVTLGNGSTGVSGVVSPTNSLVGTTAGDQVAFNGAVTALPNGNYVVSSPLWDNGAAADAGAVTFGNGTTGVVGPVTAANSLVGTTAADGVGSLISALPNGNYVVASSLWDNGGTVNVGAVTFASGTTGRSGPVGVGNSLVGTAAEDRVGSFGARSLTNGDYVVLSPVWNNGATADVGAATRGSGTTGITGAVTPGNSLVGTTNSDQVGFGLTPLTNGNYVVQSRFWDNGAIVNAGAATFVNAAAGATGAVSAANSLVGTTAFDSVGIGVTALTNGNYVVGSEAWDNGPVVDAGAVTFADGTTGRTGNVTAANSLVGSTASDVVGNPGATALANGNYAVVSASWDNGATPNAGAVTFGNGATGVTGPVSAANSLAGTSTNDGVDLNVAALTNGNYVVGRPRWDSGAVLDVGAATFASGTSGLAGAVTAANSLVGTTAGDNVGIATTPLKNGNYVVHSFNWDNGGISNAGAATFGSGVAGVSGPVGASNSLVGSAPGDGVTFNGVLALANGNYVVIVPSWGNGTVDDVGAVTWVDGATGRTADGASLISAANSLVGEALSGNAEPAVEDTVNGTFLRDFYEGPGRIRVGLSSGPGQLSYARWPTASAALRPSYLVQVQEQPTDTTIQAGTDLTVAAPVTVNRVAGAGGALTLQAGRAVTVNAGITTDDAPLTLIANDDAAGGVIGDQRDPGPGGVTMAAGAAIDTGAGALRVEVRSGAGVATSGAGDTTLRSLTVGSLAISQTAGSVALAGPVVTRGAVTVHNPGRPLTVSGRLAPGGAAGATATLSANLTLSATAVIALQPGADRIEVAGSVALGGAALEIVSPKPAAASGVVLVANDGSDRTVGTFAGLAQGALVPGTSHRISYTGGDGNDVELVPSLRPARCTIVGTGRADRLTGTSRRDVICGLGGNDVIRGLGGNDLIEGGAGRDTIDAGAGADRVLAGAGDDFVRGGKGNDTLNGDAGRDRLFGQAGNDILRGGAGRDTLHGGAGRDRAIGWAGDLLRSIERRR